MPSTAPASLSSIPRSENESPRLQQEQGLQVRSTSTRTSSHVTATVIASILGGVLLISLIVAAIIVPLRRRRKHPYARQNNNLEDAFSSPMKLSQGGLASLVGRDFSGESRAPERHCPNRDVGGMVPLLDRGTSAGTPRGTASSHYQQRQPINSSLPPSFQRDYPSLYPTHLHPFLRPPGQRDVKDPNFSLETVSTATGVPLSSPVNGNNEGKVPAGWEAYSPFIDTPNPKPEPSLVANKNIERPIPAVRSSSQKNAGRDLPLSLDGTRESLNEGRLIDPFLSPPQNGDLSLPTPIPLVDAVFPQDIPPRPSTIFSYRFSLGSIVGAPIPSPSEETTPFQGGASPGGSDGDMASPRPRPFNWRAPFSRLDSISDSDSESLYSQVSLSRTTTGKRSVRGFLGMGKFAPGGGYTSLEGEIPAMPERKVPEESASLLSKGAREVGAETAPGEGAAERSRPPSPTASELWPSPIDNEPSWREWGSSEPQAPANAVVPTGLKRMDTAAVVKLIRARGRGRAFGRVASGERQGSMSHLSDEEDRESVRRRGDGGEDGRSEGAGYGGIARALVKGTLFETRSNSRGPLVPRILIQQAEAREPSAQVEHPNPPNSINAAPFMDRTQRPSSDLPLALPRPATSGPERWTTPNPLTSAFGFGQSPSMESPPTPVSHYAFSELERAKPFLASTAPLNIGSLDAGRRVASGSGLGRAISPN